MTPTIRRALVLILVLVTCPLLGVGCSSSTTPAVTQEPGPHRGFVRPIGGEAGFIEVVNEPIKGAPGAGRFRLAVYFLNADRTKALQPTPTDVRMEVTWPDASPRQTFDLAPEPAAGDPVGAAKFVSRPIEADASPGGVLNAKLGDRAIAVAL